MSMSHEQQIEELLKIDPQYSRCKNDEQRQFVRDNMDGLLHRLGYDKVVEIIHAEIVACKIIDLVEKERPSFPEIMLALCNVSAAMITTFSGDKLSAALNLRKLLQEISTNVSNDIVRNYSPEQKKFMKTFNQEYGFK